MPTEGTETGSLGVSPLDASLSSGEAEPTPELLSDAEGFPVAESGVDCLSDSDDPRSLVIEPFLRDPQ